MYLGNMYLTCGVMDLISDGITSKQEILNYISKHQRGDYGLTCIEDVRVNERNLDRNCGTVMSEYLIGGHRVWVITSLGDSETTYTTALLPSEY